MSLPDESLFADIPDLSPLAETRQTGCLFTLSLEVTAFTCAQLVHPHAPQAALAGRSNVGKSSLVNALAGRKSLAKVSATPGKTRSINYYRVGEGPVYLVDLPGYGYARCSQAERDKWALLMNRYLSHTPGLRTLVLLLDTRLPPQKADKTLLTLASSLSLPMLPVLTKADKCNKKEREACARAWTALLGQRTLLVTSAHEKSGIPELRRALLHLLR